MRRSRTRRFWAFTRSKDDAGETSPSRGTLSGPLDNRAGVAAYLRRGRVLPSDSDATSSWQAVPPVAFPLYTSAEIRADGTVHAIGLAASVIAVVWLLTMTPAAIPRVRCSALVYGGGLVGTLAASAAYNLVSYSPVKTQLRRLDHAMIYVMIAGSYTPFALNAMSRVEGTALCGAEWMLAVIGIVLAFIPKGRRGARVAFALYLAMGWLVVLVIGPLARILPAVAMIELLAGGLVYTAGALVHARGRMQFHNAIWHAMVVVAAGLQFLAVESVLRTGSG